MRSLLHTLTFELVLLFPTLAAQATLTQNLTSPVPLRILSLLGIKPLRLSSIYLVRLSMCIHFHQKPSNPRGRCTFSHFKDNPLISTLDHLLF